MKSDLVYTMPFDVMGIKIVTRKDPKKTSGKALLPFCYIWIKLLMRRSTLQSPNKPRDVYIACCAAAFKDNLHTLATSSKECEHWHAVRID